MTPPSDQKIGAITPVVLSGGVGSRLWPLSRSARPKQFLKIHSDVTLFQETVKRVSGDGFGAPLVVCNQDHRFLVAEQFRDLGLSPEAIVLEPVGRNTAPAIAAAALIALENDPDALLMVLPSDHVIADQKGFEDAVLVAEQAARKGHLVTFGIAPMSAATGYGYILQGEPIKGTDGCFRVERFVEKPDAETAKAYLAEGRYTWNSGMFMFQADRYLKELEKTHSAIVETCRQAVASGKRDLDFFRLDEAAYKSTVSISIDYAVMEKTEAAAVVPADMGWSDVGAWTALLQAGEKDENGNVIVGDVMTDSVRGSYIHSEKPFVAVVGLDDIIVVATDDAVLVVGKDHAQDVRRIADWLKDQGRTESETASRVYRPWGYYQIIDSGEKFQAKQLMLNPGAKLSLQRHEKRAEHWVVVEGTATVTRGDKTFELNVNESTFIPLGTDHRLENKGKSSLRLIEVQSGDYLSEDDIVRLDDIYGRT
ncbi:MAG: mannose-1-phosphate guanylyltransferase/mannose-6-phosphate isomerase [Rhodospirillales bacterium]|nr:mannose-1-phosphate guanylyltransferase/mannose-6-phosphate isomerase [Rhodospirillales bacterium]